MADTKYRAGTIPVTQHQMDNINKAMQVFEKKHGVTMTRSQALAMIAHWYVQHNDKEEK